MMPMVPKDPRARWLVDVLPPEVAEAQLWWEYARRVDRMNALGVHDASLFALVVPEDQYTNVVSHRSPLETYLRDDNADMNNLQQLSQSRLLAQGYLDLLARMQQDKKETT